MTKIDLKKTYHPLYGTTARAGFVTVDVPPLTYLMVDGMGDPNTAPAYRAAIEALFSLSYALKFTVKKTPGGADYGVMPLEALWWTDDMADFSMDNKAAWKWTAMIMQPDWITADLVAQTRAALAVKKNLPALADLRLETLCEGRAAQCLYVGPYHEEPPTIERLHTYIHDQGGQLAGKHHEIYLNDMRRTDPTKLKTIIRQPMV